MYLRIYPLLKCNLSCSYCYVSKNGKIWNSEQFKKFYEFIDLQQRNIKFEILGGEPLLLKNLDELCDKLLATSDQVEIFTNGILLKNLDINKKVKNIVTLHDEHISEKYLNDIKEGMIRNPNSELQMFFNNSDIIENIKEKEKMINFCEKNNFEYFFNKVNFGGNYFKNNFLENSLKNSKKEKIKWKFGNKIITYSDLLKIYKSKNFNFQGCLCKPIFFELYFNGDLRNECKSFTNINIFKNPKKVEILFSKCTKNFCDIYLYDLTERYI